MKKTTALLFLLFMLLGSLASAQSTLISGSNIIDASGKPANGTVTVSPNVAFTATDGTSVQTTPVVFNVTNGVLVNAVLEPNIPGTWYQAVWRIRATQSRTATWVVPSASPWPLSSTEIPSAANPPLPSVLAGIQFGDPYAVGAGGVIKYQLVDRDGSNPVRVVNAASGSCGFGVALSTVSTAGTAVTVQWGGLGSLIADNTVTAGHLIVGGTTTPGRGRDSGQTDASLVTGVCTVGFARTSAAVGNAFIVQFTGPPLGPPGPRGYPGTGFSGNGDYAAMVASSPAPDVVWVLTNALDPGRCDVGGGTATALCRWDVGSSTWRSSSGPHGSTHGAAGADPVTVTESQVTSLATDLGAKVPNTRQVNGQPLSSDVSLTTASVPEGGGNLYLTNSRVLSVMAGLYQTPITGSPATWPTTFPPASHVHSASDVTSGVFNYARLGSVGGDGSGTHVLYDDGAWRVPTSGGGGGGGGGLSWNSSTLTWN